MKMYFCFMHTLMFTNCSHMSLLLNDRVNAQHFNVRFQMISVKVDLLTTFTCWFTHLLYPCVTKTDCNIPTIALMSIRFLCCIRKSQHV